MKDQYKYHAGYYDPEIVRKSILLTLLAWTTAGQVQFILELAHVDSETAVVYEAPQLLLHYDSRACK